MHTVRQAIYAETERLGIECAHTGELYDAYTIGDALLTVTATSITVDRTDRRWWGVVDVTETYTPDPHCAHAVLADIIDRHDRRAELTYTGDQLREIREREGWTQVDFAAKLGINRSSLRAWEAADELTTTQSLAVFAAIDRMT